MAERAVIRTRGTLRHTRFRVGHIRPLCHLSNFGYSYISYYFQSGNSIEVIQRESNWLIYTLARTHLMILDIV